MEFTIYSAIGEVTGCYVRQDVLDILPLLGEGESFVQGRYPHSEFYFEEGAPIAIPASPSETAVFDYTTKTWIEPFTPEQIVQQKREVAVIDRYIFCSRCLEKSILSASDALELSHGNIPPATRVILDTMDPADSADAEMRWAGMMTVRRLDPLIVATMAATGIPDVMLDHIFNVLPYSHEPEPEEAP